MQTETQATARQGICDTCGSPGPVVRYLDAWECGRCQYAACPHNVGATVTLTDSYGDHLQATIHNGSVDILITGDSYRADPSELLALMQVALARQQAAQEAKA
jgi:ribosomal protein S27AE